MPFLIKNTTSIANKSNANTSIRLIISFLFKVLKPIFSPVQGTHFHDFIQVNYRSLKFSF
jgi:hypothetical protein